MIRPGGWRFGKWMGGDISLSSQKKLLIMMADAYLRKSISPSFESSTLPTLLKLRMAPRRELRMSND